MFQPKMLDSAALYKRRTRTITHLLHLSMLHLKCTMPAVTYRVKYGLLLLLSLLCNSFSAATDLMRLVHVESA
ncbi:hypothetical protein LZ31DRAFT_148868 [Colletotrichum somersetense]|nr:hypothetical protein LZ31DRAFT_148868 [Colletotrichum somersetense]